MDLSRRRLLLAGIALGVPAGDLVTGRGGFLDQARELLDGLYATYGSRDLATTATKAGLHLRALTKLDGQRMSQRTLADLLGLQARLGALRARALADAGQTGAARESLAVTIARSVRARDYDTLSYAYVIRAAAELYDGRSDTALSVVEKALDLGGDDARVYATGARAHAARGEAEQADTAIRIAERLAGEQDAPTVGPPAPGAFSRLEWARAAVDVYARTGAIGEAQRVMDETVTAVPEELRRDTELALGASLAVGLAASEPDRGADALRQVLEVSATMGRPARTVTERVDAFVAASDLDRRGGRHPAVRDLVELRRVLDV
jgi:tetratricopeptide (TPR) repeat protein